MSSKEAKKWILGILVIVFACGCYFYYTNQQSETVASETKQEQAPKSIQSENKSNNAFGISNDRLGEHITIKGTISDISSGKGHVFPIIKDPSNGKTIKGALFSAETSQKYNKERSLEQLQQEREQQKKLLEDARSSGQMLTFEGQVDEYKGELEIIINKVY